MDIITNLLPTNCYASGRKMVPQGLIIHFTSGLKAYTIFKDLIRGQYDIFDQSINYRIMEYYRFSAHIFITRNGQAYQWVPYGRCAWHAGLSILNGRTDCNNWCVGIELASTGCGYYNQPAYTDAQYNTVQVITADLMQKYKFGVENISGHDIVRQAAIDGGLTDKNGKPPPKKYDPGEQFQWKRFLEPLRKIKHT